MKAIILTGISRGLGKAFFDYLIKTDNYVICFSRSFLDYQKNIAEHNHKIFLYKKDLSNISENFTEEILQTVEDIYQNEKIEEIVFINNASVIDPIGKIGCLDEEKVINAIRINTITPILLTNIFMCLYQKYRKRMKLLNITSGAAKRAIDGWAMYCSTKAAIKMYFDTLHEQYINDDNISVINIDPGVMNTKMQEEIRQTDIESFPSVKYFQEISQQGKLKDPAEVAQDIIESYLNL